MSNRVEELEMTVSELESTVRGLTDELVETKERLRALEEQLDVDAADVVDGSAPAGTEPEAADPAEGEAPGEIANEADNSDDAEAETSEEEEESKLGDDIIVA